ncbi:vacuolar protein 14 C-terminal Fig4p binding-domain-containing protein [Suillus fuscotomentosus]|uniref:Vacuolar protein 14 C-terminal Fig4p binding-domain-containing protein n=1 Tax=Suillus fuscotomentosus TaxID=1912939 RepID=A0AAD4E8H7_9AGAM|nr:vacuolar protein 14 C-terminal Fig4p binding-domain-containing protein [Suillus fuscotomentosus]KAG1901673.1 vacuolar protein 14 C-terminal Fig4p binding-domain-containing protein [Suillus fuscotomentosus]
MDTTVAKQLVDKIYEKRKAAALELEKQIRECHQQSDQRRITQIIEQLVDMFSNPSNPLHIRNGGLIGLAGTAIALGVDVAPYMEKFVEPVLACFTDPENRIRYFSAECLYNIAKVSKGEVLVYFNPIFDALSKLAADSELSVKNGAELLDRLLKDIVAETASVYIPQYPETERIRDLFDSQEQSILVTYPDDRSLGENVSVQKKAFSLARFIPLLQDRIYVISPFTRSYLVSWITVLDSVPELELITYLPEFLDGLLKYLSDPTEDVRVATENILADFLREIRDVSMVRQRKEEHDESSDLRRPDEKLPDITMSHSERALFIPESDFGHDHDGEFSLKDEHKSEDYRGTGALVPGQGVRIDYAAIIEILIQQLDNQHDEIQQSTALRWLAEFLTFVPDVMVPFTPRLIPAILPNLAHHVPMIQSAALRTNKLLMNVIQNLPGPVESLPRQNTTEKPVAPASSPAPNPQPSRQITVQPPSRDASSPESMADNQPSSSTDKTTLTQRPRSGTMQTTVTESSSRPQSRMSSNSVSGAPPPPPAPAPTPPSPVQEEADQFNYQATVNELTIQFLSEHEQTRVTALKWLIMLHQKAPKKILAMDDGTFPALLKTLSDSSEEVIKHDLQLLAQISSSSEESYFKVFMMNLLELFSTDRKLLEARGSLIIRQLCLNLNTERIYKTFAEILEKEEDLEFASDIVQKLNMILITSPELAEFRKRLKSLETRQDGQALFTTLYRSWCHNPVAVFSLCLLAQAYEHASNLLSIFADLEITVPLLVQVDKLVQLIESPVFTYLRLQLLEPERYPYLFKCLYGLLMLLPQSTAFVSLRNRLNAVNSAGFLHIAPKAIPNPITSRSKLGRDEIKWQELLNHFRALQSKHEKARRQDLGNASSQDDITITPLSPPVSAKPPMRRRVTGDLPVPPIIPQKPALSPLNPKARQNGLLASTLHGATAPGVMQQRTRRTLGLPVVGPRKG